MSTSLVRSVRFERSVGPDHGVYFLTHAVSRELKGWSKGGEEAGREGEIMGGFIGEGISHSPTGCHHDGVSFL